MSQFASSSSEAEGDVEEASGNGKQDDRTTRRAALLATLIALPLTVLVAFLALAWSGPDVPVADPTPTVSSAHPQLTTPVEVAAPALPERAATVCRALLSQLPDTVRGLAQRPVIAGAEQNAAYGDPALTLSCGAKPVSVAPTDEVWVVNGVCWHSTQTAEVTTLTTVDREVPVRVNVPRVYQAPLQWVAPISESLIAAVPSGGSPPDGCRG